MKIVVIGTGYVGLVTGTCFSETGNYVTCVDIDKYKVDRLNSGKITIYEPGLEKIFLRNVNEGRLKFTTKLEEVLEDSQIIFLALPTPPSEDGSADLKYVLDVANKLGKLLNGYKVIVNKSTVPVGTADMVKKTIELNYKGKFDVVSNPEFLREGVAVDDFMKPDRIVVGTNSEKAKKLISQLYTPFVRQGNPIIFMNTHSSELTKYAANSFLATKISFMNEIAQLCERMGANVDDVRKGIGTDERIGKRFLFPGIGYGGSCFPKDVKALINSSEKINYDFKILKSVEKVNSEQKLELINKINFYYNNDLNGKHFGLWGLAFKPNTDDIREAPALNIINELIKRGASLQVYDPEAMANVKDLVGDKVKYSNNQYDAIKNVDALIIATEWNEFRTPNFDLMKTLFKNKVIFDGRNLYQIEKMKELGYHYESIGRPIY
jgi:UDPglucose 6-dehydrogenase